MKNTSLKTLVSGLCILGFMGAGAGEFVTKATVLGHEPIFDTVLVEEEQCRYKKVRVTPKTSRSGTSGDEVLTGVLGGALGSAVGKGSGRDAATAAGVVLGKGLFSGDRKLNEGEIIGGIIGGLAGNQVGGGSGKTAATGIGALVGSELGDNFVNGERSSTSEPVRFKKRRVCDIVEKSERVIVGYRVSYKYGGRKHSDLVRELPGKYISVYVNVGVEADSRAHGYR